jgi:hypothetical protein
LEIRETFIIFVIEINHYNLYRWKDEKDSV